MMGGKQSQSRYCLGPISPKSLILGMCVCLHTIKSCILHAFLTLFIMKRAAFQFNYEKRGREVGDGEYANVVVRGDTHIGTHR